MARQALAFGVTPSYVNQTGTAQRLSAVAFVDETGGGNIIPPGNNGNGRGQGGPNKGPHKSPGPGKVTYTTRRRQRLEGAYIRAMVVRRRVGIDASPATESAPQPMTLLMGV